MKSYYIWLKEGGRLYGCIVLYASMHSFAQKKPSLVMILIISGNLKTFIWRDQFNLEEDNLANFIGERIYSSSKLVSKYNTKKNNFIVYWSFHELVMELFDINWLITDSIDGIYRNIEIRAPWCVLTLQEGGGF